MAASPLQVARGWVTWRGIHLGLCLLLLAPLLLTDVPPLLDYPNHLARAFVLAFGSKDAVLSRMYEPHWQVIPNLAIDLVLPPLLRVFPVHIAGRMVIGLALLLPVLGTLAYSRATFGTWRLWPLCSGLIAYNAVLLLGFLNFLISVGLALLTAAFWARFGDRRPVRAGLACAAACAITFLAHLGGVLLLLVLIAAQEIELLWLHWRVGSPKAAMLRLALRRAPTAVIFLPALLLYTCSPLQPSLASGALWLPASLKLFDLAEPFLTYNLPLDLAAAAAVPLFVYVCCRTAHGTLPVRSSRRAGRAHRALHGLSFRSESRWVARCALPDHARVLAVCRVFAVLPTAALRRSRHRLLHMLVRCPPDSALVGMGAAQ